MVNDIEKLNDKGLSNCDFGRKPCTEISRDPHYSRYPFIQHSRNIIISFSMRQFAAEVTILSRFLLLPQTNDPKEADIFLVPYFMAVRSILSKFYNTQYCKTDSICFRFSQQKLHSSSKACRTN